MAHSAKSCIFGCQIKFENFFLFDKEVRGVLMWEIGITHLQAGYTLRLDSIINVELSRGQFYGGDTSKTT